MQCLDMAKQEHIQQSHPWTEQLALAYRVCCRSCKRGLGPEKQAAALLLDRPTKRRWTWSSRWPYSRQVTLDFASHTVTWPFFRRKPTLFWAPRGSIRAHCQIQYLTRLRVRSTPWRLCWQANAAGKAGRPLSNRGWADPFQSIAAAIGLPSSHPDGTRAFTARMARGKLMAARGTGGYKLCIETGHRDSLARVCSELETRLLEARPLLATFEGIWQGEVPACAPPAEIDDHSPELFVPDFARGVASCTEA